MKVKGLICNFGNLLKISYFRFFPQQMHCYIYKSTVSSSSKSDRFFWFNILLEHQHTKALISLNCIRSNILVEPPKLIWSETDLSRLSDYPFLFNILNLPNKNVVWKLGLWKNTEKMIYRSYRIQKYRKIIEFLVYRNFWYDTVPYRKFPIR